MAGNNPFLAQLAEMLPPPDRPACVPTRRQIEDVETRLNLTLPDDYKELVALYGAGRWQGFFVVLNPCLDLCIDDWSSPADDDSLLSRLELPLMRHCREQDTLHGFDRVPYAVFPEEGGLLPWARTENGGCMFWLTEGNPSSWKSVYYEDSERWSRQEFEKSCSELLFESASGQATVFYPDTDTDGLPTLQSSPPGSVFEPASVD